LTPTTEPVLELIDATVVKEDRRVLDGLTLTILAGEHTAIVGPNGAGKSLLVKLLTHEERALAPPADAPPVVRVFGAGKWNVFELRSQLGIVSADLHHRFVLGNNEGRVSAEAAVLSGFLATQGILRYGAVTQEMRTRAADALTRMGVAHLAKRRLDEMSTGEARRVLLARALVTAPRALILDEPTTGLDEGAFRATWSHLRALNRERGLTLLLTTHRPEEAEHCDRLGILDGGKLIACDTPEQLRARVRGDLVVLETEDAASIAAAVRERLGLDAGIVDGRVLIERERGHELVPRIVEAFPDGTLRSVSIRRAGLGEVFLELTGRNLEGGRSAA